MDKQPCYPGRKSNTLRQNKHVSKASSAVQTCWSQWQQVLCCVSNPVATCGTKLATQKWQHAGNMSVNITGCCAAPPAVRFGAVPCKCGQPVHVRKLSPWPSSKQYKQRNSQPPRQTAQQTYSPTTNQPTKQPASQPKETEDRPTAQQTRHRPTSQQASPHRISQPSASNTLTQATGLTN